MVRGALPADLGRCERGHRAASAARHRARSGSRAAGYAAQHTRVRRPDARQPAAELSLLSGGGGSGRPRARRARPRALLPSGTHGARPDVRARRRREVRGAPHLPAAGGLPAPLAGEGPTPRVESPAPPRGRWVFQPQGLEEQARGLSHWLFRRPIPGVPRSSGWGCRGFSSSFIPASLKDPPRSCERKDKTKHTFYSCLLAKSQWKLSRMEKREFSDRAQPPPCL